jgi:preprotein translocase SecE subunit
VARDRQRAKQRKARREKAGGTPPDRDLTQPVHEDVPGELEHASGEVEQFDAELIAGAEGRTAPEGATDEAGGVAHPEELSDEEFAELEDEIDEVEEAIESGDQDAVAEAEEELDEEIAERRRGRSAAAAAGAAPPAEKKSALPRFAAFLRASWAELQRVQWPDRRQVGQATAVVLGFVVVAGAFLGLADVVAQRIVNFII